MRILLLNQLFDPEPNHLRGLSFAKALVRLGHTVGVLTGFPNYPGGRLYGGYRVRPLQREVADGIPIIRVPAYLSHDRSSVGRIASYVTHALSASIAGPLFAGQVDVVHVDQGPATLALPALVLRALRRTPYVYDIGDIWPDSLSTSGMFANRLGISLVNRWCETAYRHASRIIVLSPGFKKELCRRQVPREKIHVIYNWTDEVHIGPAPRDERLAAELGLRARFTVMFAGTMGMMQGLDAVLEAAKLLAQRGDQRVQFVFVGGGVEAPRLRERAARERIGNVVFVPRQPVSHMSRVLSLADAVLVHLKDSALFRITVPQKTQAYLAAGKPIIMGVRGDAADLVLRAGAGIACVPEDPESIVQAVEALSALPQVEREAMGLRGRSFYLRELAMDAGIRKLEEVLRLATGRGPQSAGAG